MEYVGIDWASRRAAWCALDAAGELLGEGVVPADRDGLTGLVARRGLEVSAAVEMMSGAVWVADTLRAGGWRVQVADARKAKALAPLAAKTDRIDARVLAELCRRELVPELWVASLDDRALRERLLRRMHLVRLRTSAKNRIFGLLSQWGLRVSVKRLRQADGLALLERLPLPEVWRVSIAEALAVVELLDERIAPIDAELAPLAHADGRVRLLRTIPGVGRAPVGRELAHRTPVEGRLAALTLGGGRGRPAGLAATEPLAPTVRRRPPPAGKRQRRQGRRRPQGPDRLLARTRPQRTLQACCPRGSADRPGKLLHFPGRLTAHLRIEKPGQLQADTLRHQSAEREVSPPAPHERRTR